MKHDVTPNQTFRILFICTGNVCRSPMAEASLRFRVPRELRSKVTIVSAGMRTLSGLSPTVEAELAARLKGYSMSSHRSKALCETDLEDADLILCMEPDHVARICEKYPHLQSKTFTLRSFAGGVDGEIPDPYGLDIAVYKQTLDIIDKELTRIEKPVWNLVRKKARNLR